MKSEINAESRSAQHLRRLFIDFFVKKHGHAEIPSASIVPENDPTVLFTTAGMHPLVPYLMGEPHPQGTRLVDVQKCLRTDDIDEVGDRSHCTFFEMLGNWSLGDYFKDEAIAWSFEFLTGKEWLDIPLNMLSATCFGGDPDFPDLQRDDEAAEIWKKVGMPENRIAFIAGGVARAQDNWWGPAGKTGPCGPSTEMFHWVGEGDPHGNPSVNPEDWLEIWNDVFMQYEKKDDGSFVPLKQKNVDTGMGFERLVGVMQGKDSPFETELFASALAVVRDFSDKKLFDEREASRRIVVDHLRSATFVLGDQNAVVPSNTDQGYVLRRLIRRAIRHGKRLGINRHFTVDVARAFVDFYKSAYPELAENSERIYVELEREEEQFARTLSQGEREFEKMFSKLQEDGAKGCGTTLDGKDAFHLYDTYGFPIEMTKELCGEKGIEVDMDAFNKAFEAHQELSRKGAEQKFAGGLADHSEACKMHHTATHLVHQALRDVLGDHVFQKGSNITRERLRFDFNHPEKMTKEQIAEVETIVNKQIERDLPVHFEMMDVDTARASGAIGLFDDKYAQLGNKIKVYIMGDYSKEVCGGPHVEHTGVLKHFKINKEEACSSGIRRIKAVVDGIENVA